MRIPLTSHSQLLKKHPADKEQDHQGGHNEESDRTTQWPVGSHTKLAGDRVPNHLPIVSAQHGGGYIIPCSQHKGEYKTCYHPWHTQRECDLPECLSRTRAQIARGFNQ